MKILKNVFKKSTDKSKASSSIDELLTRGVEEVIDKTHLEKKLRSGKTLRIKLGIDPTSPDLHLGRSIPLLKLRDFQELGHKVVFIIGDFTGVIGDTSDKESERPMQTHEQIEKNMKTYADQAGKILDMSKCEVRYNSEWLSKLGYAEIGEQADQFSLAEFIARENIAKRLEAGTRISLRELLYPLMQGYDSVAIESDVELGGTDQRFNLLAGRELQKHFKQEPQDIIMNPLVAGTDGRKMSSSWGNTITLTDAPNDMYGKIMSIPDDLVITYFVNMTRVSMDDVSLYEKEMNDGGNPRDYKMKLAYELVRFYHSNDDAKGAQDYFVQTFAKKEIPDDIPALKSSKPLSIIDVLIESGMCASKSDARRQMDGGGVKIEGVVVKDYDVMVELGQLVQKGKRFFVRLEK